MKNPLLGDVAGFESGTIMTIFGKVANLQQWAFMVKKKSNFQQAFWLKGITKCHKLLELQYKIMDKSLMIPIWIILNDRSAAFQWVIL